MNQDEVSQLPKNILARMVSWDFIMHNVANRIIVEWMHLCVHPNMINLGEVDIPVS
jgi:hypothetical protein